MHQIIIFHFLSMVNQTWGVTVNKGVKSQIPMNNILIVWTINGTTSMPLFLIKRHSASICCNALIMRSVLALESMLGEGTPCMTLRRFLLVTHISMGQQEGVDPGSRSTSRSPLMQWDPSVKWLLLRSVIECIVPSLPGKLCQNVAWCTSAFLLSVTFPHSENHVDPEQHHRFPQRQPQTDWLCVGPQHPELDAAETPSPDASAHHFYHYSPKCFLAVHRGEWDISWHHKNN